MCFCCFQASVLVIFPTINDRTTFLNIEVHIRMNIHLVKFHEIILISLGWCIVCAAVKYRTNKPVFCLLTCLQFCTQCTQIRKEITHNNRIFKSSGIMRRVYMWLFTNRNGITSEKTWSSIRTFVRVWHLARHIKKKAKSNPYYRPMWPRGFWSVKAPDY